jgi:hypothetical protein
MLWKLIGVPQVSPLQFKAFATQNGVPYLQLTTESNPLLPVRYKTKKYQRQAFLPKIPLFLSHFKLVYCASAGAYTAASKKIESLADLYIVLVHDNPTVLGENGVELVGTKEIQPGVFACKTLGQTDLLALLVSIASSTDPPKQIELKNSAAEQTIQAIMDSSALHLILKLFYKIKDHQERSFIQNAVFLYLAGSIRQIGRAGEYSSIVEALADPKMKRLREACLYARDHGVDEAVQKYGVEKYEIVYLFSRTGLVS